MNATKAKPKGIKVNISKKLGLGKGYGKDHVLTSYG